MREGGGGQGNETKTCCRIIRLFPSPIPFGRPVPARRKLSTSFRGESASRRGPRRGDEAIRYTRTQYGTLGRRKSPIDFLSSRPSVRPVVPVTPRPTRVLCDRADCENWRPVVPSRYIFFVIVERARRVAVVFVRKRQSITGGDVDNCGSAFAAPSKNQPLSMSCLRHENTNVNKNN